MKASTYLLVSILLFGCAAASAQRYEYSSRSVDEDFFSGRDVLVLDTQAQTLKGNHGGQKLQRCRDAANLCFRAPSMIFSVPRANLAVGQRWKSEGQVFAVLREETIFALGQKVQVNVIYSPRTATRIDYFYYSESRGLIAMKFVDVTPEKSYVRFLLLEGSVGFPR